MERVIDLLVEASLHGVVAALAVELLIRRLPVGDLRTREQLRVAVLVLPLVSVPVLLALAPQRLEPAAADWLLFSSARWNALRPWDVPVRDSLFVVFALLGLLLLSRDAVRHVSHALWARREQHETGEASAWLAGVEAQLNDVARRGGPPAVPLRACAGRGPVLAARGFLRPHVVVSHALASRLRPEGLRAALAHEMSHVVHRDVLRNALLEGLRVLQWFNPVAQVLARRVAQEREWRADDDAVRWTGNPTALARALIESARAQGGDFLGVLGRARIDALSARCHRLLEPPALAATMTPRESAAVAAALGALVFMLR